MKLREQVIDPNTRIVLAENYTQSGTKLQCNATLIDIYNDMCAKGMEILFYSPCSTVRCMGKKWEHQISIVEG